VNDQLDTYLEELQFRAEQIPFDPVNNRAALLLVFKILSETVNLQRDKQRIGVSTSNEPTDTQVSERDAVAHFRAALISAEVNYSTCGIASAYVGITHTGRVYRLATMKEAELNKPIPGYRRIWSGLGTFAFVGHYVRVYDEPNP
jgi:hypothetical protein